MKRLAPRWAALAAWLGIVASAAGAQVTTHGGGSILIFPRVMVNAAFDTAIRLSNRANRPAYLRCHYLNAALLNPDQPPGPLNERLWIEVEFRLVKARAIATAPSHPSVSNHSTVLYAAWSW